MAITQLFVELVVIGIGAVLWLCLFLATIFGYRFDAGIPKLDASASLILLSVAYVLGIVVDRVAHALLTPVENVHWRAAICTEDLTEAEQIERYILESSKSLGNQIQYNRSRLRICRAWVLNALLTLLAFIAWNRRVGVVEFVPCLFLVGVGLFICILLGWATWVLSRDHYKNLRDSDKFLRDREHDSSQSSLMH